MYLNLFEKITQVRTRYHFRYNDTIMFCVPKPLVNKALGREKENLKRLNQILKKKVRIISKPNGIRDLKYFVQSVVHPVMFKDLEIKDDEVIINAGSLNKAALIGRNKRRFFEMERIIKDFFDKNLKII